MPWGTTPALQRGKEKKARVSLRGLLEPKGKARTPASEWWDFVSDLYSTVNMLRTMASSSVLTTKTVQVPGFGGSKSREELS